MHKFIFVAQPDFSGCEKDYINRCFDSSWISSSGEFLTAFENNFARYCGAKHGIATNNGTSALQLALEALGIRPGDQVIVPTLTFVAVPNAVRHCGAMPVLADCDPFTYAIDPVQIGKKITPRTRAIIVVHLYGHPVDMDPILEIAASHGLPVIEDAAEAHGAEYKGRRVGGIGRCGTFSFYGNKIITTGEGGMVVTNDDALAEQLRLYRGQGQDPKRRYWFPVVGHNFRMTNLAAAIGLAQLERIDEALAARARLALWYQEALAPLQEVLCLPHIEPWARHAFWMYTVALREGGETERDRVMEVLAQGGIETRPVFYPMHLLPPYLENSDDYPMATRCGARGINLPTHAAVTRDDVGRIADALGHALSRDQK
jgi:perosamine synthetase